MFQKSEAWSNGRNSQKTDIVIENVVSQRFDIRLHVFMRLRKDFREQVWGAGEKKNGVAQPDEAGAFFVLKPVHMSRIP